MKTVNYVLIAIVALIGVLCGCTNGGKDNNSEDTTSIDTEKNRALNISIYLDLSDRLTRNMVPSQMERDIEIVKHLTQIIKDHAVHQKILPAKDRIKVFFYPSPSDSKIALLSEDLELDLSAIEPAEKKGKLLHFQDKFEASLKEIYQSALNGKNWEGSDIWGFFKKQVDVYCCKEDTRNILVILTDGYLYHQNNKLQNGDAYSYILPQTLANQNSSLIVSRKGLDNLEVLLLEVNPYDPKQEDLMENILRNWLVGMGIKHQYIGETDQPSNTKMIIDKFIKN